MANKTAVASAAAATVKLFDNDNIDNTFEILWIWISQRQYQHNISTYQHDASDQLRMEPLLYNVHVRDLKFYIYLGKMLRLLGDFVPHTPDWGSAPGPRWGTPIPQTPAPPSRISGPPLAPQLWQSGAATDYRIISYCMLPFLLVYYSFVLSK